MNILQNEDVLAGLNSNHFVKIRASDGSVMFSKTLEISHSIFSTNSFGTRMLGGQRRSVAPNPNRWIVFDDTTEYVKCQATMPNAHY